LSKIVVIRRNVGFIKGATSCNWAVGTLRKATLQFIDHEMHVSGIGQRLANLDMLQSFILRIELQPKKRTQCFISLFCYYRIIMLLRPGKYDGIRRCKEINVTALQSNFFCRLIIEILDNYSV